MAESDRNAAEKEAFDLLKGFSMHVSFDAGVNGSLSGDAPFGRVSMDQEKSFWALGVKALPEGADGPYLRLVHEIDAALKTGKGVFPLDQEKGSLWQRVQNEFASPPDIIRDVVAAAVTEETKGAKPVSPADMPHRRETRDPVKAPKTARFKPK